MQRSLFFICTCILFTTSVQAQTVSWAKNLGGPSNESGYSIAVDASGNVYTTGTFSGTADFDPGPGVASLTSAGMEDVFVSKLDVSGNFVWAKSWGGSIGDVAFSIAVDPLGNVHTTGSFNRTVDFDPGPGTLNFTSAGDWDIFISKLDRSGNLVWAKQFGSTGPDNANGIAVDAAGNVFTTGAFGKIIDFDPGPGVYELNGTYRDVFVSKLNASGNFVWAKRMGGESTDEAHSIALDPMGNIYTTGNFLGLANDYDPGPGVANLNANSGGAKADMGIFISKLDASGNYVWAKQLPGIPWGFSFYFCYGISIAADASGNAYITGTWKERVDFDPGPGVVEILANGYNDGFVLKLNPAGDFVWVKILGGCRDEDQANSVVADASGNVYITGIFRYIGDFDPGSGVFELHAMGGTEAYLVKLNASGNLVWAKQLGGGYNDSGNSIALDASGTIYTTGYFNATAEFDPGPGTWNLVSNGGADVFIHKFSQVTIPPFQWINFTVQKQGLNALLNWSTAYDQNTKNFTIQHSSKGTAWKNIGVIAAKTDTNKIKNYSYVHTDPVNDTNYYRILQTGISGTPNYSKIQSVKFNIDSSSMFVLNNPVSNGMLQVQFKQVTNVSLYSNAGKLLWQNQVNPGVTTINVAGFAQGIYLLRTNNQSKKILVQ